MAERLRLAAPGGVDAIFDVVGGNALRSVASAVPGWGALISIGGDKQLALELGGAPLIRNRSSAVLTELADAVAAQELDPYVTDIRPFEDAAQALAAVGAGHTTGKVVLTFT
jgi:NADPH2:quinone reductase